MGSGNWLGNPPMSHPDHMSSWSKDWIGWLKNKPVYYPNTGTYWINSITTMKYGDEITRYITRQNPKIDYLGYYIIETRTNNPAYSRWDTSVPIPQGYNNAIVLYQVDEIGIGNATVNFIDKLTISNPGSHSSYWDFANLIRFAAFEQRARTEGIRSIFEMNVEITKFSISNKVGAISTPNGNLLGYVPNAPSVPFNDEQPLPDFDLHAYTPDGKHVGVNYTTKVYENEIMGANASGDLLIGTEWIFVPDNVKVQFVVDSRDIQSFLNRYPDLQKITNGSQPYNLSIVYDSPDSIRYSTSVEQSILPGEVKKYNYLISRNPDGTHGIVLDNMPPVIYNIAPANATNNAQISAEFADNPDGTGIDTGSISLSIDGIDAARSAAINDGSISVKLLLIDGLHEVHLTVGDKAGNKATANWNFTLDTTPPEITISNISALTNRTVFPDIKIHDARDAKPLIVVSLDGATYNGSPIAAEGEHTLTVTASDDIGNTATQTINFIIDKTPPSISITGAENGGFYNISRTISYSIADNIDTSPLISANYVSGAIFSDENDYSLQVTAKDHAGNIAVKTLNFTIDKTHPIVNITSPSNDFYVGHIVKITGTTTDLHMKAISLEIDGTSITNTSEYLWDSTKVPDGEHEIRLNAEDKAGNTASISMKVKVDNIPPEIFNIIPQDKSVVNSTYSISSDYSDSGSGIDINSFSMLIDGIGETRNAVVTNASMQYKPSLQDGKHILKLFINDTVGNSKTVTTSFELDTTPPEVKMNSPANNSFVRRTISVSGMTTDMHLDMVSLEIDGIKVSSASTYTWDTAITKDGTHEIKLNAVDTVKNLASTSINVTVDNTPPVIQLSPANGTEFYSDQNLTIDYNVTDATSGVTSSFVTLDGTAVTKGDLIDLRNLSIGSHTIRVNSNDNAGNSAESSITFIVKPLQAIIEIEPHTLNINSSGRWIQAEIKIPGYNARLIDVSSIRLNGTIAIEIKPEEIEEDEKDDAKKVSDDIELEVKFNRTQVQSIISPGDVTLYISGKVSGAAFLGNNTIRVIENQKMDLDKENKEYEKDNKNKGGKS